MIFSTSPNGSSFYYPVPFSQFGTIHRDPLREAEFMTRAFPLVVGSPNSISNGQFFHSDDCDIVGLLGLHRTLDDGESDISMSTTFSAAHIRTWSNRSPSRYGILTAKAMSVKVRRNGSGLVISSSREGRVKGFM